MEMSQEPVRKLNKPLTVLHIAPRDRRESILRDGLQTGHKRSGIKLRQRSSSKVSDAIYFYRSLEYVDLIELLKNVGLEWDVYQVTIHYEDALVKQEGRIARNWNACYLTNGIFGSKANIAKEDVVHLFTIDGSNEGLRHVK